MPMEYIVPSLRIYVITELIVVGAVKETLLHLVQFEEDKFIGGYYQNVENARHKAWNDSHIKNKQFHIGDLVLLYDSKFLKNPGPSKSLNTLVGTIRCHSDH